MSSDYYYDVSQQAAKFSGQDIASAKKSSGKIEKGLKRLLVAAAAIIAAQLVWLFGISPFIPFSTVEIQETAGNYAAGSNIHRAEILSLAGIDESSSFFSTNAAAVREKLSAHILVESAVVTKRFPDRLSIFLTLREAAAVTFADIGARQVPIYIDRQGVFFKFGDSRTEKDLPVLSGIENPQLNMRLPSSLVSLVEDLGKMSASSPELLSAISEIRIERKAWDGYDLVLFPVHSPIRVRVENSLTEEKLRYMLLMLNVFENEMQKPHEIDFRSGMGSYFLEEQS